MHKAQSQLEEFRKKERIFNLHKRCANDQSRRVTEMNKVLQKTQTKLTGANEKNQALNSVTKQTYMTIKEYEKAL